MREEDEERMTREKMREREGRRVNNGDKTKWRRRWSRRRRRLKKGDDGGGEGTRKGGKGEERK